MLSENSRKLMKKNLTDNWVSEHDAELILSQFENVKSTYHLTEWSYNNWRYSDTRRRAIEAWNANDAKQRKERAKAGFDSPKQPYFQSNEYLALSTLLSKYWSTETEYKDGGNVALFKLILVPQIKTSKLDRLVFNLKFKWKSFTRWVALTYKKSQSRKRAIARLHE